MELWLLLGVACYLKSRPYRTLGDILAQFLESSWSKDVRRTIQKLISAFGFIWKCHPHKGLGEHAKPRKSESTE